MVQDPQVPYRENNNTGSFGVFGVLIIDDELLSREMVVTKTMREEMGGISLN